jgi:1-acyl-sn-glycerol-3-phosphate acyltransferase
VSCFRSALNGHRGLQGALLHAEIAHSISQAMQLFQFAFVDKKRKLHKTGIYKYAKQTIANAEPFALLLFPEGTLFSRLTRPKSSAFAATSGVVSLSFLPLFLVFSTRS